MRELKFRAYVEESGQKHFVYIDLNNTNVDELARFHVLTNKFGVIKEQYTGLKDRNGNEIYEGDIVKTCSIGTWAVEGRRGCFFVGKYALYGYNDYGEVIGNIHENPELIGEEKG